MRAEEQRVKSESPWAPFADKDEWELAKWLVKNVNQRATEEFLKMPGVSVSTDKNHDMRIYQVQTCRLTIASNPHTAILICAFNRNKTLVDREIKQSGLMTKDSGQQSSYGIPYESLPAPPQSTGCNPRRKTLIKIQEQKQLRFDVKMHNAGELQLSIHLFY